MSENDLHLDDVIILSPLLIAHLYKSANCEAHGPFNSFLQYVHLFAALCIVVFVCVSRWEKYRIFKLE